MIEFHPEVRITQILPGNDIGAAYVFQLLQMMHQETPHAPLSLPKARAFLHRIQHEGYVLVSVTPEGRLAGTLGLQVQSPWFSEESWLSDTWLFVHPECRRTPHCRMLIRAAKVLAAEAGMPLQLTVSGYGRRTAGKIRLVSRELGESTGALWHIPVPAAA
jgi:hypothetical protein